MAAIECSSSWISRKPAAYRRRVRHGARRDRLREVMSGIDGFHAYDMLDAGDGGVATVSVYDERAGAEESTRAAGKWLRETGLADALPNPPAIVQGEVTINAAR